MKSYYRSHNIGVLLKMWRKLSRRLFCETSAGDCFLNFNVWPFHVRLYEGGVNFSLVARYLLKFTRCLLLVEKSLVSRCKICSLLVVEVARCKKSIFSCLQNSLVIHSRSCSLQKSTSYWLQNLLVASCKRCFPVNFCEIFRPSIFWGHLQTAACV